MPSLLKQPQATQHWHEQACVACGDLNGDHADTEWDIAGQCVRPASVYRGFDAMKEEMERQEICLRNILNGEVSFGMRAVLEEMYRGTLAALDKAKP